MISKSVIHAIIRFTKKFIRKCRSEFFSDRADEIQFTGSFFAVYFYNLKNDRLFYSFYTVKLNFTAQKLKDGVCYKENRSYVLQVRIRKAQFKYLVFSKFQSIHPYHLRPSINLFFFFLVNKYIFIYKNSPSIWKNNQQLSVLIVYLREGGKIIPKYL